MGVVPGHGAFFLFLLPRWGLGGAATVLSVKGARGDPNLPAELHFTCSLLVGRFDLDVYHVWVWICMRVQIWKSRNTTLFFLNLGHG